MSSDGFRKLFWGFLFIMLDFRLQGIDVLPDMIGYIFFAVGFSSLGSGSQAFQKAQNFNIPMIILSIFSIYERPAQSGGIQSGPFWFLGILLSIAILVLNLLVVYHLFMGIKDMAKQKDASGIYDEAEKRWNQYLLLSLAALLTYVLIFIPPLALLYMITMLVLTVVLMIIIMGFMKRCEVSL